ncbi:hypothetical protein CCR85_00345 [Rhodothalassium salexigens]|uniref:cell division protein FtsX n=1 Tax=Rhodothalassium salexigens TaxID=1086 RepID=UPI001912EE7D|nr:hypothetical protein [Rhodothalassium salexigens]MBK5909943.1 hypothetical protein [Rhodothalassium salexigens]MBK5919543.1 hypothetical protein [Rhodothalassium salexigens]
MRGLVPVRFLPRGKSRGGLVPWVIAVMMYLCGLAMVAGLSLQGALAGWASGLERKATVQIVEPDPDASRRIQRAALATLRTMPGVEAVRVLPDDEVADLLAPWLGPDLAQAGLPVPVLIDVTFAPGRRVDMGAVRARLAARAPGAEIDDHARWLGRLYDLSAVLQTLSWAVVVLVLVATAAIVVFGTRAGLASQQRAVRIMHLMGAEDRTIAGEFQHQALLDGLKGGLGGTVLCLITLYALSRLVQGIGGGLLPQLGLGGPALLALLALPLFAALLTLITARWTVMRTLDDLV